jgi:polysaccharide biosynthesis/export protein
MRIPLFICGLLALALGSCGSYKHSVLFQDPQGLATNAAFNALVLEAKTNYSLRKFDRITYEVFTNKGERITDPNGEFNRLGVPQGTNQNVNPNVQPGIGAVGGAGSFSILRDYMIEQDGNAYLPVLGAIKLEGLKLYQVDSLLSKLYGGVGGVYENPYVLSRITNRRATVLGALGNRIVPLTEENMSLLEVVSTFGNMDFRVQASQIKVIRNWDSKPVVQNVDLSTLAGLQAANLRVEPNDIIYITPRRALGRREGVADVNSVIAPIATVLGIIASTVGTIAIIRSLDQ